MSAFADLDAIGPQGIWNGVAVRALHGERITLGVVELDPGSIVPEHRHENEQLGMVLSGSISFSVGEESRDLAHTSERAARGGHGARRCGGDRRLRADAGRLVCVRAAGAARAALALDGRRLGERSLLEHELAVLSVDANRVAIAEVAFEQP